eukprot:gene21099-41063_t
MLPRFIAADQQRCSRRGKIFAQQLQIDPLPADERFHLPICLAAGLPVGASASVAAKSLIKQGSPWRCGRFRKESAARPETGRSSGTGRPGSSGAKPSAIHPLALSPSRQ